MQEEEHVDLSRFRIEEAYQFAATIEQGGFDFYGKLIDAAASQRVKNELAALRDDEAKHKAFFLGELRKKGAAEVSLSPGLAAFIDSEFVKPMEAFYGKGAVTTNDDALAFGAAVEQKTIDFYGEMRRQSTDAGFQKDLDAIIAEEKRHKHRLEVIRAF